MLSCIRVQASNGDTRCCYRHTGKFAAALLLMNGGPPTCFAECLGQQGRQQCVTCIPHRLCSGTSSILCQRLLRVVWLCPTVRVPRSPGLNLCV